MQGRVLGRNAVQSIPRVGDKRTGGGTVPYYCHLNEISKENPKWKIQEKYTRKWNREIPTEE